MDRPLRDDSTEANRLYWSSTRGVNQIAEELGLSKGMFYAAIKPLPSEYACPVCGRELVYANRTALEKQVLTCSACGHDLEEPTSRLVRLAQEPDEPLAAEGPRLQVNLAQARQDEARSPVEASVRPSATGATRAIVGAAALCVGVGVMIGRYLERR